jgi:hypothetical protein
VKTIFKSDAWLRNYRQKNERELYEMHTGMRVSALSACIRCCLVEHLARREVLCIDELTLIHLTTSFYASLRQKRLYAA